ncbi:MULTISPECIES: hypothetical protein [unclassified Streptomyces]|uniref:hypothetical protein n=1 Tax=unclassified Streptomyces TaxID=2593676 RepID=UPI0035DD0944
MFALLDRLDVTVTTVWTMLGGFVPSVLLGIVGVLAGTAVDMTDPQTSPEDIVPGWFHPLLLLAVVLGSVANNTLTAYSSGLALQAVGVRIDQWAAVLDSLGAHGGFWQWLSAFAG